VLLLAAALPVIAMALIVYRPGVFTFGVTRGLEAYPGLVMLLWLPAGVFAVRALQDVHLLPWWPPVVAAAVLASLLFGLIWRFDPLSRRVAAAPIHLVVLMLLIWGGLSIANVRLDRSPGILVPADVQASGRAITARLPTDTGHKTVTLDIPKVSTAQARQGQGFCVLTGPGALGWRHVRPVVCIFTGEVTPHQTGPSASGPTPEL